MRIIELQAENVKRLRAVRIRPDRSSLVLVTGKNESGKSSVLDSLWWCLAGAKHVTSAPIRNGEQQAFVRLTLGERDGTVALIVTRKWNASGTTSLTIEASDGNATYKAPQAVLDKLLSTLTFDPLAFALLHRTEQLAQLRQMVPLDVDLDALDALNVQDREARALVNREVATMRGRIAGREFPDLPEQGPDVDALLEEIASASSFNQALDRQRERLAKQRQDVEDFRFAGAAKRDEATELDRAALDLEQKLDAAAPIEAMRDVDNLRERIREAQRVAELIRQRSELRLDCETLAAVERESEEITARMAGRVAEKTAAIAAAKMPVPGLTFGDGEVMLNALPLSQASDATVLRVSCEIAMAAWHGDDTKRLKVLRVKQGSLLDREHLALLETIAEERDFQVWVERVDESGSVGIVMVDGEVQTAQTSDAEVSS